MDRTSRLGLIATLMTGGIIALASLALYLSQPSDTRSPTHILTDTLQRLERAGEITTKVYEDDPGIPIVQVSRGRQGVTIVDAGRKAAAVASEVQGTVWGKVYVLTPNDSQSKPLLRDLLAALNR